MSDLSIIYLTHDLLDQEIAQLCRVELARAAQGKPLISVSDSPLDFGTENVCVGQIGINWRSIYAKLVAGLERVKTSHVAIAEHDCLYTAEHFDFVPTDPEIFYYNHNCWLVQWKGNRPEYEGMYSYWPKRFAQSQVICFRDSLLQAVTERLTLVDAGLSGFRWAGEAGMLSFQEWEKVKEHAKWAVSGSNRYLLPFIEKHLKKWGHGVFGTKLPNLDIRHGKNFTGPKRGKKRRWELEPWGKFEDFVNGRAISSNSS